MDKKCYLISNLINFNHLLDSILTLPRLFLSQSKLTSILKEIMSQKCKIVILSSVCSNIQHYNEMLQIVQLTSKICKNCCDKRSKSKSKVKYCFC